MPRLSWIGDFVFDMDKIVAIKKGSKEGTVSVWAIGQSAVDENFLIEADFEETLRLWSGEDEENAG